MSGNRVRFIGDAMAAVVQGVEEVRNLIGQPPVVIGGLGDCRESTAADIALHVDLWLVRRRPQALLWIQDAGGSDLTLDDLDLVEELLLGACERA